MERLADRGHILIADTGKDGKTILMTAGIVINAPVKKVWDVINDYEHYHDFLPYTEKVEVVERNGKKFKVNYAILLKFGFIKIRVKYTCLHTVHSDTKISWESVEGDVTNVMGKWELFELKGGRTLALYAIYSDVKQLIKKTALRFMAFALKSLLDKQPELEEAINGSTAVLVARGVKARAEGRVMKLGDWESVLPDTKGEKEED